MGDMIAAVAGAGLTIVSLTEFQEWSNGRIEGRIEGDETLPGTYILVAEKTRLVT
ncbi:MAG: hypothetical protein O3A47_12110 [Chloroflexi bacterium]|nr:hypothetical protein [Chloroflexota bacterium]